MNLLFRINELFICINKLLINKVMEVFFVFFYKKPFFSNLRFFNKKKIQIN